MLQDVAVRSCEKNETGNQTAVCMEDHTYGNTQDNCILIVVEQLLSLSEV